MASTSRKVDKVTRTHLIVEAMRRVHRDRAVYLGDPDFVDVPVARLINPYYAAGQRASIRMDRATPSAMLPGVDAPAPGPSTTHFSVIDAKGNMVAATITLNFFFGSGLMIPGTGILLNNQMDDFSAKPGVPNGFQLIGADANAIAPKKRPLSSSTPTFVEAPNGLMIIGSPGGSYIPGMVILGTLNFLEGRSAQEIVSAPRFHHQFSPDVLQFESDALDARGAQGNSRRAATRCARARAAGATCRWSSGTTRPARSKRLRIRAAPASDWSTDYFGARRARAFRTRFAFLAAAGFGLFFCGLLLHQLDARLDRPAPVVCPARCRSTARHRYQAATERNGAQRAPNSASARAVGMPRRP